jgi:Na+-transporting methylmalonyl-CoA/oxaloacetate decarboxylase gamma subunit
MLPSTVFAFLFILAVAMILDAAILRSWRQRQSPPATSRYVERARIWLNKTWQQASRWFDQRIQTGHGA